MIQPHSCTRHGASGSVAKYLPFWIVRGRCGKWHADAQRYYASALRLRPDEPSVLTNLGLSYALSKNLPEAEKTLRRAAAQRKAEPKVRQP